MTCIGLSTDVHGVRSFSLNSTIVATMPYRLIAMTMTLTLVSGHKGKIKPHFLPFSPDVVNQSW